MLQYKCKDMGVNMEDEELVKMFNPTLKKWKTILFFLIVVINGLIWIVSDIGLQNVRKGEVKGGGIKNGNESASAPVTKFSQLRAWISLKRARHKRNQMSLLEISTSPFALREPTSRGGKERFSSTWAFSKLPTSSLTRIH